MRSGRSFATAARALLAVLGFRDFVIGAGEYIADDLATIRLILDDQYACSCRFHLPFNCHRERESECRALAGL
jgi:hypothetical protein